MIVKRYGIVIRHPGGDRRLFGRVSRSDKGDVYVNWVMHERTSASVPPWNPHGSYHASGQLHSKSYNKIAIKKNRQNPGAGFKGAEPIEATNADRGLDTTLPLVAESFDETVEFDVGPLSQPRRMIAVDLIEPGASPVRLTGKDRVVAKKTFQDTIPWIVVSLVDPPEVL